MTLSEAIGYILYDTRFYEPTCEEDAIKNKQVEEMLEKNIVERDEFDRIFNMLYLSNERVKELTRENHKQEKNIQRLLEEIRDLKNRLGEKI